jgi:hypothetical protein
MPPILRKIIAQWRNRIETTFKEITDQLELARHGAHTFWGLLTRTAAIIAAHTLIRVAWPVSKSTHITRLRCRGDAPLLGGSFAPSGGGRRRGGCRRLPDVELR